MNVAVRLVACHPSERTERKPTRRLACRCSATHGAPDGASGSAAARRDATRRPRRMPQGAGREYLWCCGAWSCGEQRRRAMSAPPPSARIRSRVRSSHTF
eukprot:1443574-Prymnesium_polylepis.3